MNKIVRLSAVLGLICLLAPLALGDWYAGRCYYDRIDAGEGVSAPGKYWSGNGGEFTLSPDGDPAMTLGNAWYHPWAKAQVQGGSAASFQTFCVEMIDVVAQPMDITVSTTWTTPPIPQWGVAPVQPASHGVQGIPPVGDDLNPQTAYLYHHFAKGTLGAYDYTGVGVTRSVSAGQLQQAIWFIEGEAGPPAGGTQAWFWVDEAVDAANLALPGFLVDGSSGVGIGIWGQTIGDVRVLNMYGSVEGKQDQLYMIPAPGAVLLGMIGLGTIVWVRRRLT